MSRPFVLLFPILVAVFASRAACAEEVLLHGGETLEGDVVSVTADGVTLNLVTDDGGEARLALEPGTLDPYWFYRERDTRLGDDARGRLQLALWSFEHGLFGRSRVQFTKARKLDPDAAQAFADRVFPGLKDGIASQMVDAAEWDLEADQLRDAKRILAKVVSRFGDTPAASRAREKLSIVRRRLDNRERADARMEAERTKSQEEPTLTEDQRRHREDARRLLERARNLEGEALQADGNSTALAYYEQSATEYEKALDALEVPARADGEGATAGGTDARTYPEVLSQLATTIREEWMDVHAQSARIYLSRGDYKRAREQVAKIRSIDNDAPVATRLAHRIDEEEREPAWSWAAWARRSFAGRRLRARFPARTRGGLR